MRKASLVLLVVLLLSVSTPVVFSQSTTIIVPDDFSTIQEAVNAANPGDTVYVRAGTYTEIVTVDKNNLALTGENKFTTIIDGCGTTSGPVLNILGDYVTVRGFTVQNSNDGIRLYRSSFSAVSGNILTGCSSRGIILVDSSFVTVSGNTLTSNYDGIEVYICSFVSVSGNTVTDSRLSLAASKSFNNTFSENTVTKAQMGIYLWDCAYTTASGNTITNTTEHSICVMLSSYCTFSGNSITNSAMRGISLGNSSSCVASENTIKFTASQGIHSFYSSGITVSENTLTSNFVGVGFYMSSGSTVFGNTISQSKNGITVVQANNNKFYHNSLIDNQYQAVVQNSANTWDDGYPSGGNYWSDYTGTDADGDGIGDTPYVIDASNQDNYPIIGSGSSNQPPSPTVSTITLLSPENKTYSVENVSLEFTLKGVVIEPKYCLDGQENVTVFGNTTLVALSNGLHTITMYGRDSDGNTISSELVHFTVDAEVSPSVSFSLLSPENVTYNTSDVPVVYTINETCNVTCIELDGQKNYTIPGNMTLFGLSDGVHQFTIYCNYTDSFFGEEISVVFTVNTTVPDTTPPTVTVLSPANTTYTSNEVPLNFTVNEQTEWTCYSLDGQENVTIAGNTTLTELADGLHSILVYANDTSGNTGQSNETYFSVESPIFGVSIVSPENITYSVSDIPFGYLVNETCNNVTYSLDSQPFVDAQNVTIVSGVADGTHVLIVVANFTGSDFGESATVWFTVDTTAPNITNIALLPANVTGSFEDGAKVNATVTDTVSGVKQVALRYTTDNETWVTTEMTNLVGDIWNGTIPGFPHGTNVTYTITAEDMIGNIITTEDLFGQPEQYQVLPEFTSWLILPLFLAATLLVSTYKKKLHKTPNQHHLCFNYM